MRLTVELAPLLSAVKRARAVIENRQVIPILGCLHIVASDAGLRITGTNMDEWVAVKCDAAVTEPGAICVDAGLAQAWLQALPKRARVSASIVNGCLALVAGRASASFVTLPADSYPTPAKTDRGVEVSEAIASLGVCLPFVSVEESRYNLQGVFIGHGGVAAYDGYRACRVDISGADEVSAIIPSQAVRVILQCGPAARLWVSETAWHCEDEGLVASGKLIDGTFPNIRDGFPKAEGGGKVDADGLSSALSQVIMASGERARAVMLSAKDDAIGLTCRGDIMTATGEVSYDGEAFTLGINGKYAESALNVFAGNVLHVSVQNERALLTCDAMPGVRVLVMGMRL